MRQPHFKEQIIAIDSNANLGYDQTVLAYTNEMKYKAARRSAPAAREKK